MVSLDSFKTLVRYLTVFVLGFICCYILYPRTVSIIEYRDRMAQGTAQTLTKTELVYIPKELTVDSGGKINTEKTDLELQMAKQELNIKINGQAATISRADDEQYIFEKNKVQLTQQSKADINIAVPIIDRTKYWELGIGYGMNGIAGQVGFPINRKADLGGWIYGDKKTFAGGINLRF